MTTPSDLVHRYFELAVSPDLESYFAQFTPDAAVEDDGTNYRGTAQIRAWRTSVPDVHYDVLDVSTEAATTTARTEISGDFPGSPVTLRFGFGFDSFDHIETLLIRV